MFKRVPDIVIYKIFKKHLPNHYICTFWVSVGIFVVSCIVGVFIEATDFLVNILAGVASIFIGFVIAALILSKYDEVIWIRVRKMAINNLMSDLDFIFYQILTAFHKLHPDKFISLPVKYYPPDELTIYV